MELGGEGVLKGIFVCIVSFVIQGGAFVSKQGRLLQCLRYLLFGQTSIKTTIMTTVLNIGYLINTDGL